MIKQYPHTILFSWNSPATQDEETGNMIKGESQQIQSDCRAEPNGSGKTIPSVDGTLISYSYIVYMPLKMAIPVGAKAVLSITSQELTVKNSHTGQFNSRVWLSR
jgi:hypothetical protein